MIIVVALGILAVVAVLVLGRDRGDLPARIVAAATTRLPERRQEWGQAMAAELFGISGRGLLAPGAFADVNVIDLDGLRLQTPQMATDFPLGASRYVQQAQGYDYTLVNGRVLVDHGELTGERPGRLVTAA